MFERFTHQARTLVVLAQEHARRLGHHRIGCEHLLLAASASDTPAAQVLADLAITTAAIESVLADHDPRRPFEGIDEQALAAIGIDLDRIRASVEESLGPQALHRSRGERAARGLFRRGAPRGHIPFSTAAKHCLERSLREALAARDGYIGVEHVVLALTQAHDAPVLRRVFTDAGTHPDQVRTAIRERYRRAG